jgi:hypothetical protein
MRRIVDDEGKLLCDDANFFANFLMMRAYYCSIVISHILSACRNYYLYKHFVIVDSEIGSRIKRAMVDMTLKK